MAVVDALIVVSFGGPEGDADVVPFLKTVLRGRDIPPERLEQVAGHYRLFGGVSPINDQARALVTALKGELTAHDLDLAVYWGNRNWHPFLPETVEAMADDGVRHALAFVTSAYASYSGCRQYLDDIAAARATVGDRAPRIDKLRVFYDHPGFVGANADHLRSALAQAGPAAAVAFTAHSIPTAMAATSDYVAQLSETAALVADQAGVADWQLVYQSRSGPPAQPWLEPDVTDHLRQLARTGVERVVVAPIGFVSDHMEVIYDLDVVARRVAESLGLTFVRVPTAGSSPAFVTMIRQLIQERLDPGVPKLALSRHGPYADACPPDCCQGGRASDAPPTFSRRT